MQNAGHPLEAFDPEGNNLWATSVTINVHCIFQRSVKIREINVMQK